jgi:7-cyano-7-deazaguanine synthase
MRDDAALVLFGSGQDSATCLASALARFAHVETLGLDDHQRRRLGALPQLAVIRARVMASRWKAMSRSR